MCIKKYVTDQITAGGKRQENARQQRIEMFCYFEQMNIGYGEVFKNCSVYFCTARNECTQWNMFFFPLTNDL